MLNLPMNSYDHAQKGFKTFLVTLTISLVVFSVLYYFLSNQAPNDINAGAPKETASASKYIASTSPFEDLANKKIAVQPKTVLAGSTVADTTGTTGTTTTTTTAQTTASVPNTGSTEVTIAFVISGLLLMVGFYVLYLNPRKLALQNFERRFTKF